MEPIVSATIVSFLPYDYNPYLPGMTPTFFHIPKSERDDFVVIPICDCISYVYVGEGRSLPTNHNGVQVAGAIANDLIKASIHTTMEGFPGIKAIPGNHTKEAIQKMFPEELKALNQAQKNWFGNMVKAADDTWSDPNIRGKHKLINDLQRHAAKYLGLNREWLTSVVITNVECFACGFNVNENALICMNCKTVLKPTELAKKLEAVDLKKAQPQAAER